MMLGCAIEAMGEGFSLIRKYGVDPASFFDVMTDGLFAAPAYKVYGNIIAKELYAQAGFTTTLGLKDANLLMAAALAANVPLPSLSVYRDRLISAVANGQAEQDWSVIARVQARAAGIE
jgi:3-hydroxyisobutyrate dehydrogenase-like beta-hydroxyacid dehydrogenase